MFTLLRINTATGISTTEQHDSKDYLLGARTLTSRLVSRETDPTCDALGRNNTLYFANGVLSGTTVSSSNRLSIGAKSPLTGGIKESNAGGIVGLRMAEQGLRCIALEDAPTLNSNWQIIIIGKDGVTFTDGEFLAGKGVYEKSDLLSEKYGKKAGCITIGPTGEKLLSASGIACSAPHRVCSRYAGRGGLGAVMGSKKIVAIVILDDGGHKAQYADPDAFKEGSRTIVRLLKENPVSTKFTKYGTAAMVDICQELKVLPTRNFHHGTMEDAEK
jgi:aldehyde:ferredoxin oxidoreductase